MKKIFFSLSSVLLFVAFLAVPVSADETTCLTIQSGELFESDGTPITLGFDQWGYNYQGHLFNGDYCDHREVYRPGGTYYDWCLENYDNVQLLMKWNDTFMSNTSCDGDNFIDIHWGYPTYVGSGAMITNTASGTYQLEGDICHWNSHFRMVARPENAYSEGDYWYVGEGEEKELLGLYYDNNFAVIFESLNDPCGGYKGVLFKSELPIGFGFWK